MVISFLPVGHVLDLMVFNGAAFMAAKKAHQKYALCLFA